jgi:hypothetical protein
MDVREEASGATGMQQRRKDQRSKERLRLGSKGNFNETFREILGLNIAKRIAGTSFRIRKMCQDIVEGSALSETKEETFNKRL